MKYVIDLVAKFSGINAVWGKIDGAKTYLAAALSILTGLAGLLEKLIPVLDKHSWGALYEFIKQLPSDQSWLLVVAGVGALGLRHAIAKAPAAPPVALLLVCLLVGPGMAQEPSDADILSVPGLTQTIADYAKDARAVAFIDLRAKYGAGALLPIRTLKDSKSQRYAAFCIGGSVKQGEHLKPRVSVMFDATNIFRRLEQKWDWWNRRTDKLLLPEFWFGPTLETPLPGDKVTWASFGSASTWAGYSSIALSIGF